MKLQDLVGEHELSGVDSGVLRVDNGYGGSYAASRLLFVLDGVAYQAIEDEDDGYRSSMREIELASIGEVANRFTPVKVIGCYKQRRDDPYSGQCDILQLVDVVTGEVVLEVGTDNTDDYYPSFVADFRPQAMVSNKPTGKPLKVAWKL